MLSDFAKVTTFNADSVVDDKVVVRMRATINNDGSISYGKTVRNVEAYLSNSEACDADYAEFEAEVLKATK